MAGSGALGDIGAHIIDLTQFVTGQNVIGVSALTETFIKRRPLPTAVHRAGGIVGTAPARPAARSRSTTRRCSWRGCPAARSPPTRRPDSRPDARTRCGSRSTARSAPLSFDLERLNELEFYDATAAPETRGFSRILVTEPEHPYLSAWWPPGHLIGYEHSFTHQARDLIEAIAAGTDPTPSFADALQVQRVLDAVERSASTGTGWVAVADAADLAAV